MSPQPPPWLETSLGALFPPACRESVLGDLAELYRSPGQYLCQAASALPGILLSQVRRTADLSQVAVLMFVLFGLLHTTGRLWWVSWGAAAAPTLLAGILLILKRAYSPPLNRLSLPAVLRRAAGEVGVLSTAVFGYQLLAEIWAPQWLLPTGRTLLGLTFFGLMFLMSAVQSPGGVGVSPCTRVMSASELLHEARCSEAIWHRARWIELGAVTVMLLVCPLLLLKADSPLTQLGVVWVLAGTLATGWLLLRQAGPSQPLPDGLPFTECRAAYRRSLQARQQANRAYRWYLLPLLAGPAFMSLGTALQQDAPLPVLKGTLAGMAVFALLVVWRSRATQARLQRRIELLAILREHP